MGTVMASDALDDAEPLEDTTKMSGYMMGVRDTTWFSWYVLWPLTEMPVIGSTARP